MPTLTLATLEALQAEAFAEDIAIDLEVMQHWTEEQARASPVLTLSRPSHMLIFFVARRRPSSL